MRFVRRYPIPMAVAAALLAALAALAVPALARRHGHHTRTVKVGDYFFFKDTGHTPTVHVRKNAVVRWKFVGQTEHNVTVVSGPAKFHSRDMDHGVFKRRLRKQGTYLIECTIHGFRMRLVVGHASRRHEQTKPAPPPPYPY